MEDLDAMRKPTLGKSLLAVLAAAMLVAACAPAAPTPTPPTSTPPATACDVTGKTITYVAVLRGHPTVQLFIQGFLDKARELGYTPEVVSPDDVDWTKSASLGMAAIAAGTDGIVTLIQDPTMYPMIAAAGEKGIPVVGTHNLNVPEGSVPGLNAVVGFDTVAWGADAADFIGERIGGKGTVAVTVGSFNTTELGVAEGFTRRMAEKFPDVKVLEPQEEGFDAPAAIAKAVAILQANPDVVAAISTTGGGPTTWAGAQDETGRKLVTVGPDANRPNLDLAKAGKLTAIAAQPGYEEHAKAVEIIYAVHCGLPYEYTNSLPTPIVYGDALAPYFEIVDRIGRN
jgi:ribose transport system substrate-binding protein